MKSRIFTKKHLTVLASILVCCLGSRSAYANAYKYTATNNTGQAAYDLEVTLIGTGGTVDNLNILLGGGAASLNAARGSANGYRVDWNGGLANGDTSSVQFTVDFPGVSVASAIWTDLGSIGSGVTADAGGILSAVAAPEPSSVLLLGSSVLGLGGFLRKRLLT